MDKSGKLRVGLWAPVPPPVGGISRWTLRYKEHAAAYGIDVRIIDIAPRTKSFSEKSRFSLSRSFGAVSSLLQLWRLLRHKHIDVCHITTTLFWAAPRDLLAAYLCKHYRVPAIVNIRASSQIIQWRESLGAAKRKLLDWGLSQASAIVTLSTELQNYIGTEIPGIETIVVPNMVTVEEIPQEDDSSNTSRLPPRKDSRIRILYVGFRTPLKGIAELAEAVAELDNCELVMVGGKGGAIDNAMASRMERALKRLESNGRLIDAGELEPAEVTRIYREADIFALPSHREGMPNVLLEAMAAGLPCVATPVGAISDVLSSNCGRLVPVGDVAALREAMRELAEKPSLRKQLGNAAMSRIKETFSADTVMRNYGKIYRRLLQSATTVADKPWS